MIPNLLDAPAVANTSESSAEHAPAAALPGDAATLFASLLAGLKAPLVADGKAPVPDQATGNVVVLPGQRPAILLQNVPDAPEVVGTPTDGQAGSLPAGAVASAAADSVALAPALPGASSGGQEGEPLTVVQASTGHATLVLGVVAGAVAQDAPSTPNKMAPQTTVQAEQPAASTLVGHRGQVRPAMANDGLLGTSGRLQATAVQPAQFKPTADAARTAGYPRPVATPAPGLAAAPASDAARPEAPTVPSGLTGSVLPEGSPATRVPAAGSLPAGHQRPPVAVGVAVEQAVAAGQARKPHAVEPPAGDGGDPPAGTPAKPAGDVAPVKQATPELMSAPVPEAAPEAVAAPGQQSAPEPATVPTHHAAAQSSAPLGHATASGAIAATMDRPPASMVDLVGKPSLEASAPDAAGSRRIQAQVTRALLSSSGLNSGDQTLTLQLEPDHLGKVEVRLLARGDRLEVTFTAETPEAQQALREGSSDLIRSLAGRVDGRWQHVDVKVADPSDPRREQAQQDQRDQDRPRDGRRESDQQERRRERRQNQ